MLLIRSSLSLLLLNKFSLPPPPPHSRLSFSNSNPNTHSILLRFSTSSSSSSSGRRRCPSGTMSSSAPAGSGRTVADVLMGAARAAAAKKAKKSPSSPVASKPMPDDPAAAPSPSKKLKRLAAPAEEKTKMADGIKAVKLELEQEPKPKKSRSRSSSPASPKLTSDDSAAAAASSPCKNAKKVAATSEGKAKSKKSPSSRSSSPAAPESTPGDTAVSVAPSPSKKAKTLAAAGDGKTKKTAGKLDLKSKKSPSSRSSSPAAPEPTPGDTAAPSPSKKAKTLAIVTDEKMKKTAEKLDLKSKKSPSSRSSSPAAHEPTPDDTAASAAPSPSKKAKTLATLADEKTKKTDGKKDARLELKKKGFDFNPKTAAFWKDGDPVPFLFFVQALDLISNESGRIAITDILCNVFRTVIATTPKDLLATVYLSANRIAAPHEGIELGIGDASLIKALAEAYGSKETQIKLRLKEKGDLGSVANASRSSMRMLFRKPHPLTIPKVLDTMRAIAKESGKDSQEKKRNHIKALLVAATDSEPQYIVRLLQAKMRIGLAEKTVLVALGQAAVYAEVGSRPNSNIQSSLEEASNIIKQVYSVLPIYDKIIPTLLDLGVRKLPEACKFSVGVPVGPMLAKPTKSVSEILDKFQGIEFTCEYKYDGERAQIHYIEDGSIEIYSRNAERNTGKYPDVVGSVSRFKKADVKSFVLDCEIVAYDCEKQKILPFQVLSTRARKGVIISDIKVAVCAFAFDILYINGQPLLQQQLKVRREYLYKSFEEVPGVFQFATAITSNDLEEVQKFLDAAVNSSSEGLIIKTMDKDATYEPSKRSNNWLKLKKDYMESIGDSLDLVPIAAFHGRGKRTGVYGAFLLACYDEQNDEYQSICKIGTGFSESQLEQCSASLRSKIIPKPKPYYRCADTMNPDVWFDPAEVWEVKAADLSISPVHRAANGIVDPNKGISLRFPRLLRVRDDKKPEEATTAEQVADMFRAQKINHGNNQEDEDDD